MAVDKQDDLTGAADVSEAHGATRILPIAQLDVVHPAKFSRVSAIADEFGNQQISEDARTAAERTTDGRFYVACVGQFKRGKSTLLNALIGEPVLPSGITPVTAVPTILRFGERHGARVRLKTGDWTEIKLSDLESYISEGSNPENRKGVSGLEVSVPSPLLRAGMCLVDTPGIGSVFSGNTDTTHAFLPHTDAVIVVIGADPPIAGDELALVERVAGQIPNILFVLNKVDRVSELEKQTACVFARQVLEGRLSRPVHAIFEVSALEQLNGNGSSRDWSAFVSALESLDRESGCQIIRSAASRSLRRLSKQLCSVVDQERDALLRPFADSERQIVKLRAVVSDARQSLDDLGYLFLAEQQRLSKTFTNRRERFLTSSSANAHQELALALAGMPRVRGPQFRRAAMQSAIDITRFQTMAWLEGEQKHAEDAYRQVTTRFAELAVGFLIRAKTIQSADLLSLRSEVGLDQRFRTRSEFHFHQYTELAQPASPLRYFADTFLEMVGARSVIAADAHEFLDRLLETNSERVRNDLENRVSESRRRLESEIRIALTELSAVAERALTRARAAHQAGTEAVESSLRHLAEVQAELAALNPAPNEP
jgi:hypothetical protein